MNPFSRITKITLVTAGVVILWLLLAVVTYYSWIHGANHRDFYPLWAGARLALFEKSDLYSNETTRQMQTTLYGRELPPEDDQQAFAYPAILVPLLLPFWLIGDVEIAAAVWEATSVLLLVGALLLVSGLWGRTPFGVVVLLLLWCYPLLMIFQAQVTAIPLLAVSVGLAAYVARRDVLAGAALVAGFVKPELVLLPTAVLFVYAMREQRWRVLMAFMVSGLLLFAVSTLINGWWIPRWLEALGRYNDYASVNWVIGMAWNISPIVVLLLVTYIAAMLLLLRRDLPAAFAASVPLGMLVLPQTLIWGLTMLTLTLVLAWRERVEWAVVGVWLLGWLLMLSIGQSDQWRLQTPLLSVLTLGVVVWASRKVSPANDEELRVSTS